jgi:peptidoglycan/LPS O-acetylase OafA/YrhL
MAESINARVREQTVEESQRPEKIHALTSLRFFAALFVVCYHTINSRFPPWVPRASYLGNFFSLGYISVSFFFLLSGYILSMVYLRRNGPVQRSTFYAARFARVYPLFFLTLVLDTPNLLLPRIATYGAKSAVLKTVVTFAGNTAMLQAWFLRLRGINNPNWSLSVETLFYLSFPFLGVALWKLRGAGLWLAAAIFYVGGQTVVWMVGHQFPESFTYYFAPLHLSTFALGILLARWQVLERKKQTGPPRVPRLAAPIVVVLALCCFGVVVYFAPNAQNAMLGDGLLAPLYAAVIWAFSHSEWLPARILSARWLVVLGEASFGLYLIHTPIFHVFEHYRWHQIPALSPVYLALCIGLSVLSFYYFESPMRRWIMKQGQVVHVKESVEMASDAQ